MINKELQNRLLTYKTFQLTPQWWRKIGEWSKARIREDMRAGILQGKPDKYKSETYVDYKKRFMTRKTDRTGTKGSKLKSLAGRSVVSNVTKSVNMMLTGELIRGLHVVRAGVDYVRMSYRSKDRKKIEGNVENYKTNPRIVTTLRKKWVNLLQRMVEKAIDKKLKNWARQSIIIDTTK